MDRRHGFCGPCDVAAKIAVPGVNQHVGRQLRVFGPNRGRTLRDGDTRDFSELKIDTERPWRQPCVLRGFRGGGVYSSTGHGGHAGRKRHIVPCLIG